MSGPARRLAPIRATRDRGAVAIVVALCVAGLVLPLSALTVDLGMLYTSKAQLATAADQAAKAGAQDLPDVVTARATALATLCSPANRAPGWSPGVCGGSPTWPTDGNLGNGEISFYEGSSPATGALATTIKVISPPATVDFAFASAFTSVTPSLQRVASAALGTPLGPIGAAPLLTLPGDLATGSFCVLDVAAPAGAGGTGCADATARRGFVAEKRLDSSSNLLERNLKSGMDPRVHRADVWPCANSTALVPCRAPWPAGLDCLASPSPGILFASPLLGPRRDDVNCVRAGTATSDFGTGGATPMTQLRRGLISNNSRGQARLRRSCGGPTYPSYHSQSGIDSSTLFTLGAPWINPTVTAPELASASAAIAAGAANPLGKPLFTAKIYECPRFSVTPVVTSALPLPVSTPVTTLRYLWIGSADEVTATSRVENGLIWNSAGASMLGVRGYAFDASYLPQGPRIGFNPGPFLGGDLSSVVSLTDPSGLP